jgi:hypothetical protein
MAIAVTNAYEKVNSTSIPAYNSGTGSDRALVVVHVCFTASPTAMSYGGQAMTLADSQLDGDSYAKTFLYYLMNPPAGSNSFSITGGTTARELFFAVTLTGVNTNEIGNKAKALGQSVLSSVNITPNAAGNLIIYGVSSGSDAAITAAGGATLINEAANSGNGEGAMLSLATTGLTPQAAQANVFNDFWTTVAVEFKAAATANTGQFFPFF